MRDGCAAGWQRSARALHSTGPARCDRAVPVTGSLGLTAGQGEGPSRPRQTGGNAAPTGGQLGFQRRQSRRRADLLVQKIALNPFLMATHARQGR